ncbi:MAG: LLM class flavin-dependent oxidoreductase [Chloroflexi bacterium]|nr:LLM class flavin-dependent oxidoreductase [Chloroflexota bacterium]
MRAGFQVGHVVLRGTVDHQQQWQDLLGQFRAVNDAGFDSYCYGNHFLIDPFQHFQPWTVLARMAAEPSNMTLATSVLLLPLLNPVEVAEQAATLDHISEGRFVLGVGLGYRVEECEAFGIKMSERGGRITESLQLMRRLWTEDEVTHHGKYYNVTGARPTARPYQKPYPKVWQAAMSDPAIRRVGRTGDILFVGPAQGNDSIRKQIDLYHSTLGKNGHETPEEMVIVREFFCARTHEEAIRKARAGFETKYEVYAKQGLHGTDDELARKVTGDLETLMEETFVIGSPEECLEQISEYKTMGFTDVVIRLFYPKMSQGEALERIDLVGRELIPEMHRL